MLRIDYVAAAHRDFDESFDWYNQRSTQAAVRFADAVDEATAMISAQPTRFASRDGIHRECQVKAFPFRVI